MVDRAKLFIYLGIISYFIVVYGQGIFEFGSEERINFYFTGIYVSKILFALALFLLRRSCITSFWLSYVICATVSDLMIQNPLTYTVLFGGVAGLIIYTITEKDGRWF